MISFFKDSSAGKMERNKIMKQLMLVIQSGQYILGNQVQLFEEEFAKYCGSKFCVGVGNGTDALYLAIRSLNLEKGSEILLPSNSFIATALAIVHNQCIPIPVPILDSTHNIDPAKIKEFIGPKTKAILLTHMYGQLCDMDAIMAMANLEGLWVIEDCAHAHGLNKNGKYAGNYGLVSAFSFYPTKNLGAMGDGGAVLTNSAELAERIKTLRTYGMDENGTIPNTGINSRLDEMQAAILRVRLQNLDKQNKKRKELAKRYFKGIKNPKIQLPQIIDTHVYHLFVVTCQERDSLKNYLLSKGIETKVHYPLPYYLQVNHLPKPKSEYMLHKQLLSLPLYPGLASKNQHEIIQQLNQF
jgi:dTDP-4-amino-4,6-dideoxygalactose transaminase